MSQIRHLIEIPLHWNPLSKTILKFIYLSIHIV